MKNEDYKKSLTTFDKMLMNQWENTYANQWSEEYVQDYGYVKKVKTNTPTWIVDNTMPVYPTNGKQPTTIGTGTVSGRAPSQIFVDDLIETLPKSSYTIPVGTIAMIFDRTKPKRNDRYDISHWDEIRTTKVNTFEDVQIIRMNYFEDDLAKAIGCAVTSLKIFETPDWLFCCKIT